MKKMKKWKYTAHGSSTSTFSIITVGDVQQHHYSGSQRLHFGSVLLSAFINDLDAGFECTPSLQMVLN